MHFTLYWKLYNVVNSKYACGVGIVLSVGALMGSPTGKAKKKRLCFVFLVILLFTADFFKIY